MQIHKAAAQGDKEALMRELELSVPVDEPNRQGLTPLMLAISSASPNIEIVQLLLDRGANPNAVGGSYPESVLVRAVNEGDPAVVEAILDAGADINLLSQGGMNVLTSAMHGRSIGDDNRLLPLVELLLQRGASVLGESDYGESALSVSSNNGRYDVVKRLLEAGADESILQWTPLMRAIAIGSLNDVRDCLEQSPDLSAQDRWERTPWLIATSTGDIEKAKLLLAAGANRDDGGRCGKTVLVYPIESNHPEMLKWLLDVGCDVEATDEFGDTALMAATEYNSRQCVQILLDAGADPNVENHIQQKAIAHASTLEVVRLFLAAGQSLEDTSAETRAVLLGLEFEENVITTREEYEEGRERRFGTANPEKMDVPFWRAMVKSGSNAYSARREFASSDDEIYEENTSRVWCHKRFGMSLTELPDGRFIEIGGEHEDYYDPDFCIYNEVFVHHPDQTFEIYGYPETVFPPTDFHSATLAGDFIYIIGCMGYPDQRVVGDTPVYRLNLETFAIEKVETSGDNPGWISRHRAVLIDGEIHISGGQIWNEPQETPENGDVEDAQEEADIPMEEDFASTDEWMVALDQYLKANKPEKHQSPERFILNLKSLEWRRDAN